MPVSVYERRQWARRADTIHRKAEHLFSDMMQAVGEDHPITDLADNLMEAAAELSRILERDTLAMWRKDYRP